MSFSNGSGGTLTLPSPTHHHVDVSSAVRSLRRSLSRSPSKFRLVAKSPNSSPHSPLSPSPQSPSKRDSSGSLLSGAFNNPPHTPSPLAVPFPPSAKLALRSSTRTKTGLSRPSSRTRTSPKSPLKRGLSQSPGSGNVPPASSAGSVSGQENQSSSNSPVERKSFDRSARMSLNLESHYHINHALSRLGGDGANDSASTSSPLKRSDAIMNLDQASLGSPVAKRRSLHGSASFGHDFNVFDHGPPVSPQFEIHDDANYDPETSAISDSPVASPVASIPRRTTSLRKSTLQQRHGEKTSWGRRHAAQVLAAQQAANTPCEVSTPNHQKNHSRLSLDQFVPPMARDSPFSSQGSLPSASIHLMNQNVHQPHPLSRTMTTSSSSSSLVDDSPTHVPVNFGDQPRPKLDFSKSLPAGSLRPFAVDLVSGTESSSFSTPQNFKTAKPLPAAFMSTGLISKVNRNPESQPPPRGTKGAVPDTPCKKPVNGFATYPAGIPGSAIAKARHIRHSFGTPSTPFNLHGSSNGQSSFGKSLGVFGSTVGHGASIRRGSFLSVDGEDGESPDFKDDSYSSNDYELPPTPTKQVSVPSAPYQSTTNDAARNHIKGSSSLTSGGLGLGFLKRRPKSSTISSEQLDLMDRISPHTPEGNTSDTAQISAPFSQEAKVTLNEEPDDSGVVAMPPPATPTAGRDYFSKAISRHLNTTPISGFLPADLDDSLTSRFENVEMIGTGEFSQVYRVTQTQYPPRTSHAFYLSMGDIPLRSTTPPTPMQAQIFAVKKSRQPYQGFRDRQRKLQEVNVLQALGHSDHVVHLVDSWEENNHLFIQTEFCEEGSLDLFLSQVGRKGRLDDFRIWKIMLELSLGLKNIHDSGYIHLDLKPANVFITFEGVLKIGDFGMATSWPAPSGIEGEGDREYIGPEILLGQYDKPADVFALGLIMLEIAGNVQLPDNGPTWQRLRSGDMTDVPSLTWSEASSAIRDANGIPVDQSGGSMDSPISDEDITTEFGSPTLGGRRRNTASNKLLAHNQSNIFGALRRGGELVQAPHFMRDMYHDHALDKIVRWMISPRPQDRPIIHQVLESESVKWVQARRRAGATVFEGNWGPADDVLADDAEMIDV